MSEQTPQPIDADDPGLTAYALGELEGTEAARYRAAIAASSELQAAVAEIQATSCLLTNELAREPQIPITAERRTEIAAQAGKSQPVAAIQKRAPRFSRRVAVVAASVALIPGAWYAFQIAFPRTQRSPVIAEGKMKLPSAYHFNDDVQYFPASPDQLRDIATWRDQSAKRTGGQVLAEDGAPLAGRPEGEVGEAFEQAPASPSGARRRLQGIGTFGDAKLNAPSGPMVESPGLDPVFTGPLPIAGLERQTQSQQQLSPVYRGSIVSRGMGKESGNHPAPNLGESNAAGSQGQSVARLEKFKDLMSKRRYAEAEQIAKEARASDPDSPESEIMRWKAKFAMRNAKNDELKDKEEGFVGALNSLEWLDDSPNGQQTVERKPGQKNPGGPGQPIAGARKGVAPVLNKNPYSPARPGSLPTKPGKPEASDDAEGVTRLYAEADPYLGVPLIRDGKLLGLEKAPGEKEKGNPSAGRPVNNINSQFGDLAPPFGAGRNYKGAPESKSQGKLAEKEVARGRDKPDTFDFTDESLTKEKLGIMRGPLGLLQTPEARAVEKNLGIDSPSEEAGIPVGEAYKPIYENAFITPQEQQLSTFSIDVDTASYANLRRFVQGGQLPPPDAVRIEELVNYFSYQYPQPQDGRPFSVQTDIAACPWQPGHQLVRIGLKGKEIPKEQRSPTNLVFLVDVSGSMQPENKLPLVRESLKTLVNQLDERDKVAIVTYAGEAGVRLPSTSVAQKEVVLSAIASLVAGGSTNGAAGISTAYDIAAQEFLEKGTNRVILCTDGDFNVGVTSDDALVKLIQTRAKGGVFLSVFGFGMGNLKDAKLEQLADKGNGQYGYIDDQQEANKVFVQELMGTLVTIAKDVKIQIDFNKDTVASYRLVGYENRIMAAEDFHDDKKDAGEIGAGHTVTALYQIVPIKDLKANNETRWLTVKLRYKQPDAATSVLMENPLVGQPGQLKLASSDFQFAASVAACGMLLRHSQHAGQANWGLVKELAQSGLSYDPHGHRRAFIGLAAQAESLMGQLYPTPVPATDSTVGGKYKSLLRRVHAPGDAEKYGQFKEQGHSDKKAYAGAENLPEGFWVYAAPYWYIWAETTAKPKGPAF